MQIHFDSSLFFVWKTQQRELTERRQDKIKKEGLFIDGLAKSEGLSREYVGKVLRLTYLAPDIVTAIIDGVYPKTLSLNKVLESEIPILWRDQRIKYGFSV